MMWLIIVISTITHLIMKVGKVFCDTQMRIETPITELLMEFFVENSYQR